LETSPDYEHVSKLFLDTINGIKAPANPIIGKKPRKMIPAKPGPFGGLFAYPGGPPPVMGLAFPKGGAR
jgi:hypothetical protein